MSPAAAAPGGTAASAGDHTPAASVRTSVNSCAACWGLKSPSIGQAITTAVNHLFGTAFTWLSSLPANPISAFLEGALVLIRRTVFGIVPTGVAANQVGAELTISVATGSIAYLRQTGTSLQVASDPLFVDAQQFNAATVDEVAADGTAAGCAGLVFTAGDVNAGLQTSGIDSLNFGSSAQFEGNVDATLTMGTLLLSNAVRGVQGVELDAPSIRLATNVAIDAGTGGGAEDGAEVVGVGDAVQGQHQGG